jgi:Na+-driven multidrug efflux pump
MLPASAMSMAVASMTAQNIGAGHYERGKKSMKIGIEVSLIFAIVIFIWIQVFPQSVMRIFTDSIEVINAGASYMRAFSFDFMAVSFAFCMNGFFNGCGHTTFSLINGVLSTILVRVPLAYVLSRTIPSGLFGVGLAAPLASLFSIIVGLWYIKSGRWKTSEI